jgi:CheY-like chemotaxis protein
MERNLELLVVDDDIELASNLRDILETEGYSTAASSGVCHRSLSFSPLNGLLVCPIKARQR